ncbi:MAG: DUF2254 domain-containing protein [Phycisphaerales bacterium]|nr:DUF2254 domain-containing protein [Hyphomonadaceae bacterium]
MNNGRTETYRRFALQAAVLGWVAVAVFWLFYAADYYLMPQPGAPAFSDPFTRYFAFDPSTDSIASLVGVNVAVFGIVITVVSIIVQLSADRYTGVARMFLRDRLNIRVAAYYVVTCVASVWLAASGHADYVPRITLFAMLSLTMGGLVITMPYFGYVFWFLEPQNLVRHIRRDASASAENGALQHDEQACFAAQAKTLFALEELTDIANNSISGKDKIIASASVDALKDFAIDYLKLKPQAGAAWFTLGPELRQNPDFVAMDTESLSDLVERRTWIEWKVMRQYLSIYNEALSSMRDINYVIAIDTRYIGEAACEAKDSALVALVFRFFNSYLRSTLNARDVRTTYNVLNQYRKLNESMLTLGNAEAAIEGVRHMKYYGLMSFESDLSFVTETVAYDLAALAQLANECGSPAEQQILADFLELDRPPFVRGQDRALMGVRKAQVKLAAYYISTDQLSRARAIADDMREEPLERLRNIRRQLDAVENKDFWEIIDRGRNFEYMPPQQRECLATFFDWFDLEEPAVATPP